MTLAFWIVNCSTHNSKKQYIVITKPQTWWAWPNLKSINISKAFQLGFVLILWFFSDSTIFSPRYFCIFLDFFPRRRRSKPKSTKMLRSWIISTLNLWTVYFDVAFKKRQPRFKLPVLPVLGTLVLRNRGGGELDAEVFKVATCDLFYHGMFFLMKKSTFVWLCLLLLALLSFCVNINR